MRKKTILLLNVILLVTFLCYVQLEGSDNGKNRCLTLDGHGNCSCCKSGFRGQTCHDSCEHCLSHLGTGQSCTYYCQTGYYGTTCDKTCPTTCAPGINGQPLCTENNGFPFCVKCIHGYYGKQCDQICDINCQNRTCYKADGECLSCSSNEFYGDHCRLSCSQGCVSGTCNKTGHCTDGCKSGFYGERCDSLCGSNCKHGKCTSHGYHAYNCTEGCHGGYWGTSCLEKCPNNSMECEQQSGRCTLCVENYVHNPGTGECEKVLLEGNLAVSHVRNLDIFIIVLIVLIAVIVVFILCFILTVIWKMRGRHRDSSDTSADGSRSKYNDNIRQNEDKAMVQPAHLQVKKEDDSWPLMLGGTSSSYSS